MIDFFTTEISISMPLWGILLFGFMLGVVNAITNDTVDSIINRKKNKKHNDKN